MSKVVSMRLSDGQIQRLEKLARREKRTVSAMAALMLEEAIREREFPRIAHQETIVGRQAFIRGTRLKVWHIARLFEGLHDARAVAEQLAEPVADVEAALGYAEAFSDDIRREIEENDRAAEELMREIDEEKARRQHAAAS